MKYCNNTKVGARHNSQEGTATNRSIRITVYGEPKMPIYDRFHFIAGCIEAPNATKYRQKKSIISAT